MGYVGGDLSLWMEDLLTRKVNVGRPSRTKSSEMLLLGLLILLVLIITLQLRLLRCVRHIHCRLCGDNDGLKVVRPGTSWETREPRQAIVRWVARLAVGTMWGSVARPAAW